MLRKHKLEVHEYDGLWGGIEAVSNQLASACRTAGYHPWPSAPFALSFPAVFWWCVHVILFVILPILHWRSWITDTFFIRFHGWTYVTFFSSAALPLLLRARPKVQ